MAQAGRTNTPGSGRRTGRRRCATRLRSPPTSGRCSKAENAYADAVLASTANLQKTLVAEMRARIQEDDSQPPQADGPWAYYSRFRPGGQHRILCRRPRDGGEEAILIDGDALAAGKAFFSLAAARHAPDHAKLAWGADELGSELLTLRVRDLAHGAGPRRPRRQRRARHRLDARRDRASSMSSRTRATARSA